VIISQSGRHRSVRTDKELADLIGQEYESMDTEEREIFAQILEDYKATGTSPFVEVASASIYKTRPVSMETFLTDPYYLGDAGKTLFPILKDDMTDMFSGRYEEANFSGSIGYGKSSLGRFSLIRMVYEASLLWNPQEVYDITSTDKIEFACISVTEDAANEVVFDGVNSIIKQSPYFQEKFKPLKVTSEAGIVFPNNIIIPPGMSTEKSAIGRNILGCVLDEGNFFRRVAHSVEVRDYAKEIYDSIKRRMKSRFERNGKLPGIILLLSSKKNVNSFTEQRIRVSTDDPKVFVREYSLWDVHDKKRYSPKRFRVAIGTETTLSRILVPKEQPPEGSTVIDVPEDFRKDFEDDLDGSIRDIAGYSTIAITPFIQRRNKIAEAIDTTRVHPFSEHIWQQDVPGVIRWDMLAKQDIHQVWKPLLNPSAPRHVHLDLSKNKDRTGLAIGHIGGWTQVQAIGGETEMAPIFVPDFTLAIAAPPNGEIIYSEIRRIIYEFALHGYFIKLVSADSFQSLAMLQTMRQQGFNTKVVSVDLMGPYDVLKQAFYENRMRMYRYEPLLTELRTLEKNWKTGKVDHPDGGTKDVADALTGVVTTLSEVAQQYSGTSVTAPPGSKYADDDEQWVLESAIPVEKSNKDNNNEAWKDEVEKRNQAREQGSDLSLFPEAGRGFQLPFEMG